MYFQVLFISFIVLNVNHFFYRVNAATDCINPTSSNLYREAVNYFDNILLTPYNSNQYTKNIALIQLLLKKFGVLTDEKEWVDRAIRNNALTKNLKSRQYPLQDAIDELLDAYCSSLNSQKPITKHETDIILDKYFYKTSEEVTEIASVTNDAAASAQTKALRANQNAETQTNDNLPESSLLDTALQCLNSNDQDTLKQRTLLAMKETITMASSIMHNLRRNMTSMTLTEKDRKNIYTKYTLAKTKKFVQDLYDYLFDYSKNINVQPIKISYNPYKSFNRETSTLISMKYPVSVPGGRFVEMYYWDSYWIIRGLLTTGKIKNAIHQLKNLFSMVDRYGYIPNGGRLYYLERSQPPLLATSVLAIYEYLSQDVEKNKNQIKSLLFNSIPRLLQEYFGFWMNPRTKRAIHLQKPDSSFNTYKEVFEAIKDNNEPILNRYYSFLSTPRQESFTADLDMLHMIDKLIEQGQSVSAGSSDKVMQSIRAAAESGWDFSSRWLQFEEDDIELFKLDENIDLNNPKANSKTATEHFFRHINTISIIPVDLNAFLYKVESIIAHLFSQLQYLESVSKDHRFVDKIDQLKDAFVKLSKRRAETMGKYLIYQNYWTDYNFQIQKATPFRSAAQFIPLWAGVPLIGINYPNELLAHEYGVATSSHHTGQQWDFPNVWPPLVQLAIQYLDRDRTHWDFLTNKHQDNTLYNNNVDVGFKVFLSFIHTVINGYVYNKEANAAGYFYEKYHSKRRGVGGSGGEYANQIGFGWTNGVIIELVSRYGCSQLLYKFLESNAEYQNTF